MKRDPDLITKLLSFIETEGSRTFVGAPKLDGYLREAIVEHLHLLNSGGFIDLGSETLANRGTLVLTWKGCDYLDEIRSRSSPSRSLAR